VIEKNGNDSDGICGVGDVGGLKRRYEELISAGAVGCM
jgi:hypothetical protein